MSTASHPSTELPSLFAIPPRRNAPKRRLAFSDLVQVTVHDTPLINVSLTHHRIKEENGESANHKRQSMTVRIPKSMTMSFSLEETNCYLISVFVVLFSHIDRITMFLNCGRIAMGLGPNPSDVWFPMHKLMAPLIVHSLFSISIKVAFSYKTGNSLLDVYHRYLAFTSADYLLRPPRSIAGLPHIQRAEAYRLSSRIAVKFMQNYLEYSTTKVGCYIYRNEIAAEQYWTASHIVEEWPNTKLGKPNPDNVSLTSRQLHSQYKAADCFINLSVNLDFNVAFYRNTQFAQNSISSASPISFLHVALYKMATLATIFSHYGIGIRGIDTGTSCELLSVIST